MRWGEEQWVLGGGLAVAAGRKRLGVAERAVLEENVFKTIVKN